MANNVNNVGFTDFGAEQQAIARRQKLSEMLLNQGLTPIGPTETVGGWAIKKSPWEGIAKVAQAGVGAYGLNKSEAMQKVLAEKIRADAATQMSSMPQGTPAVPAQPQPALGGEDAMGQSMQGPQEPIPAQPAQMPDPVATRAALSRMLSNPLLAEDAKKALGVMITPPKQDTIYKQTTTSADTLAKLAQNAQQYSGISGNTAATIANQTAIHNTPPGGADQWGEPYNAGGALVQRNNVTGQIRQAVARPPQVHINQGQTKIPMGYRETPEGNLQAIPGGPADTKLQGALNQDTAMLGESMNSMDRLATEANSLIKHPGLSKSTGLMSVVPVVGGIASMPGSDAANFKARLDTLKSQVGFGVLQNMRNNSKTGGALGQVSNIEEKLLQDNLAALSRAQSATEFKAALTKIVDYTDKAKDRLRNAYNMKHKDSGNSQATETRVVDW